MPPSGSKNKVANSLVAVSSAAVLAVYGAGYTRTRAAASRLEAQAAGRRPPAPGPVRPANPMEEKPPAVPEDSAGSPPEAVSAPQSNAVSRPAPAEAPKIKTKADPVSEVAEPSAPVEASTATATVKAAPAQPDEAPAPVAAPKVEAAVPPPAPPPAPVPPASTLWKDGTYLGWGSSRHGDIQASVVIANGRIESATIAQCRTRYSCSVIERLPPEVAQRQSPEVDYVSGATQSADAFYYAVVDALSKAK